MSDSTNDILYPVALILPKVTTAVRNTMVAEVGTIIYNTTSNKLNFCKAKVAAAASWEAVTSVQEA
jgi:hypothetical protein